MTDWRIYEHTHTIELIQLIKMKSQLNHLDEATAAFHAFCFRFQQSITKKAEYVSKNNGYDKEFAIEIIEMTFQRFWKYPQFNIEKINASSLDKGVEIYLSKIAQNSFYDLVKEKLGINISPYNGMEEIIYDIPIPENRLIVNNENYIIVKKVLDTFSLKHRVIYLTYAQYEINGCKLPRKLLTELREKLDITQNTIRSYRFEVINKINEYKELWKNGTILNKTN